MAPTFLHGLALKDFRGIGSLQRMGPFSSINFFVGANNAGKSAILRFISMYLNASIMSVQVGKWHRKFDSIDVRLGKDASEVRFLLAYPKKQLLESVKQKINTAHWHKAETLLNAISQTELIWLKPSNEGRRLEFDNVDIAEISKTLSPIHWRQLWNEFYPSHSGGDLLQHWVPIVLSSLVDLAPITIPDTKIIPAIRQVGPSGQDFQDLSGVGLIDRLAELQNPPHDQRKKREMFDQINLFLAEVTGVDGARIEVPYDRRHLLVHMGGKVLPLESLGTGVHEVIMIASFCTLCANEIVCIEEPEIHLHPLLQRRLLKYLQSRTANQYFVATHSSTVLDSTNASIFSVGLSTDGSRVNQVSRPSQHFEVCAELGYRASDLLQANSVIWVEGPSDRIYLNYWIRLHDPDLIEGIDYSVMYYGGRLLSGLSGADDADVGDFISLRRLNRNSAIMIDSDRRSKSDTINSTKRRVSSEFSDSLAWVTAGREIENYFPLDVIGEALSKMYRNRFDSLVAEDEFSKSYAFRESGTGTIIESVDKVALAKLIVSAKPNVFLLDLSKRLGELVEFVRRATI